MIRRWLPILLLLITTAAFNAWALQDPTRPTDPVLYFGGGNRPPSTSVWTLQSILSAPDRRIAIINGTRLREGDRIGNARVVSIKPSHVVLNTGKGTLTLQMLPETIKKVSP
jgi:MSHA biogenesis protein MshK